MQTTVTFKNLDPSDHLKDYVSTKLDRFDKLLDNPAEAHVVLSVEKIRHIAEIRLKGDRLNIVCREKSSDMYSSIDLALDKLEKQLKKQKAKLKDRRHGGRGEDKTGRAATEAAPTEPAEESNPGPDVIVENIEYKPMDIEEAVMQMELIADSFLVFRNARTEQVNVLYRRNDGDLGLIQPLG
ncbi:MAG: ribosome-associated translation inhibitor RaiA [Desulfobacteraceae bacterium]|nr:ribosome-associated translation inhibitor RaiA [Desulfobacteraceae bacterium]